MEIDKSKLQNWLRREFAKTKGVEIANRLDWMNYCLFIFRENYNSLAEYADATRAEELSFDLFTDYDYSTSVYGHYARHLQNFLVSSKSLIEHTRGNMRVWYKDTLLLKAYEQEVSKRFAKDPLSQYVECLRNYCVHRSPLGLLITHDLLGETKQHDTYIAKDTLLDWKKIPALAKTYLSQFEEDIPAMEPLIEYKDKVIYFREWLRVEMEKFHTKELHESKWYVQALRYVEEENYDLLFRSCGLDPSVFRIQ